MNSRVVKWCTGLRSSKESVFSKEVDVSPLVSCSPYLSGIDISSRDFQMPRVLVEFDYGHVTMAFAIAQDIIVLKRLHAAIIVVDMIRS